jgi:chromosome segregation ATPase
MTETTDLHKSGNTDLYNIRERMSKQRENIQSYNSKYLELTQKLDESKQQHDLLVLTVEQLIAKNQELEDKINEKCSFVDIETKINEWSSAELQPVLNELCNDIENAISEVKLVKQKQLQSLESFSKMESDNVNLAKTGPFVKTLQLQKKTRL